MDPISKAVVPLVGTWIEIQHLRAPRDCRVSFPLWERGLKLQYRYLDITGNCRSPCGNVD